MPIHTFLSLTNADGRGWVSSGTDETRFGTYPAYKLENFDTSMQMDEVKDILDGVIANLKRREILPPDYAADHYSLQTNRSGIDFPESLTGQTIASVLGYSDNINYLWFTIMVNRRGGKRRKSRRKTKKISRRK